MPAAAAALTQPEVQDGQWDGPPSTWELPGIFAGIRVQPLSSLPGFDPVSDELFSVDELSAFIAANSMPITAAEGLGAARGVLICIGLEAAGALLLFGLWNLWHIFQ